MNQTQISVSEAKSDKLFYIVASVIIVNSKDATCLLLKRSEREKVFPGKWGYPGGKLEHTDIAKLLAESGNAPIEGVTNILGNLAEREAKEECGLNVDGSNSAVIMNKVFVRPDGTPVFMALLTADYTGGEVVLEADAFSDFAWVGIDQLTNYDCIEGVHEEVQKVLAVL